MSCVPKWCQFLLIVSLSSSCVLCIQMVSVSLDCPFVFVLCLVYPNGVSVSWLSLCLRPVSCVPKWCQCLLIAPLSSSCVLCTQMVSVSLDCPFVFVLCLVYPNGVSFSWLSPCLRPVSCVPKWCQCLLIVHSGLSLCLRHVSCVPKWCQCLFIVHSGLSLCLRHVSCVPNSVSFTWLSILDCPFVLVQCLVYPNGVSVSWLSLCLRPVSCVPKWCQCLLIVPLSSSCVLCTQMVSVSLDCPFVFVLCLVYPNGVSVSWLSPCLRPVSCVPKLCQCLLIVHSGLSLCLRSVSCVPKWCQSLLIVHSGLSLCLRPVSCVPKWCQCVLVVHSGLSLCLRPVSCVPKWCQCVLVVHSGLSLCLRPVSCVSNSVSVSWLSILDCPFVFVLCLVYSNGVSVSWLSLCLRPVSCVPKWCQCVLVVHSGLSLCLRPVSCVPKWCQCLLIVHSGLSLCLRPVSCVPNWCQYLLIVHYWLSFCLCSASCVPKWCQCLLIVPLISFCVLCTQWCQCLWIVHSGFSNVYLTRKIGTFSLNLNFFSSFFCFVLASMKIARYDHMDFASFTLFWFFCCSTTIGWHSLCSE